MSLISDLFDQSIRQPRDAEKQKNLNETAYRAQQAMGLGPIQQAAQHAQQAANTHTLNLHSGSNTPCPVDPQDETRCKGHPNLCIRTC